MVASPNRYRHKLQGHSHNIRHLEIHDLQRAIRTVNDAIELCFLHSEAYRAAFELFQLEKAGELVSDTTAKGVINEAIEQAGRSTVSPAKVEPIKPISIKQHEDVDDGQQAQNGG